MKNEGHNIKSTGMKKLKYLYVYVLSSVVSPKWIVSKHWWKRLMTNVLISNGIKIIWNKAKQDTYWQMKSKTTPSFIWNPYKIDRIELHSYFFCLW